MLPRVSLGARSSVLLFVIGGAIATAGCDGGGGLLKVEGAGNAPSGHTATELVSNGTMVKSQKYQLLYVMGQPTPNQNVTTSGGKTLKGGLVGAGTSGDGK